MPVLDNDDLQDLADLVQDIAMDLPCIIKRNIMTEDAWSSQSEDSVVVIETVCSLEVLPVPVMLEPQGGRLGALVKWNVSLPLGTNPLLDDIFVIEGQEMIAQRLASPKSFSVTDDVLCAEVTG